MVSGFGLLLLCGLAYWLGRRGHHKLAAFISTIMICLVMAAVQYLVGLGHATLVGLAITITVAGLLLRAGSALVMALICTLVYLLLGLAQQANYLPQPIPPQNSLVADFYKRYKTNRGIAHQIGYYQTLYGDWRTMYDFPDKIREVTAVQVKEAAARYFTPKNSTTAVLVPEGGAL